LLKLRGKWWLIDPVFGERTSPVSWAGPKRFHPPPVALEDIPPIEGLVLSHDHYDHLDVPTIDALKERVQKYFVPLGVGARLRDRGVPADRIEEFDWWQESKWGDVVLTAAPAQHFSGRTLWDRNRTLWASWLVRSGNERIFYSGDTGYFPGLKEIGARVGPIDIALMENGAYDSYWPTVHMTPEETVQGFQDLGARTLYLVHNSTFDLAFHGWRERSSASRRSRSSAAWTSPHRRSARCSRWASRARTSAGGKVCARRRACPRNCSPAAASARPSTTRRPNSSTCIGTTSPCLPTSRCPRKCSGACAARPTRPPTGKTGSPRNIRRGTR
jgi:L-ascorbate metabolism protein UlaG (beta-lactamase superfamily)